MIILSRFFRTWSPWLALLLCIVFTYLAYRSGFSGSLYYDDFAPLSRLARVENVTSALYFIFSDISGPLGRPIAMASFLAHAGDWPDNTAAIFRFNTLIHLANSLLIAGLAFTILDLTRGSRSNNTWLAVGAAILWLLMPIQVSTSLIAIQRMASLSGFFVFSGLLLYTQGIRLQLEQRQLGIDLQLTGILLFTSLAVFAKENGALLPVFALVIELTLLARCKVSSMWRKQRIALLGIITLSILAYLAHTTLGADSAYLKRPFTLAQRLMTEPQILMEYLRLAFIPSTFDFNPFHDNYEPVANLFATPQALFSFLAFSTLSITAIVFHRRFPLYAFGVLWFLTAHLLESTVISLELYFEHRNYVAMFGPCFAVILLVERAAREYPKIVTGAFLFYLLLQALILAQVTSLWGERLLAAEMWYKNNPSSSRASAHLAAIYNNEHKDPAAALRVMDRRLAECPQCLPLSLQAVMLSCILEEEEKSQSRISSILHAANSGFVYSASAVEYLQDLHGLVSKGTCSAISLEMLEDVNLALLQNRFVRANGKAAGLHVNLHSLYRDQGKYDQAMDELLSAWTIKHDQALAYPMIDLWLTQEMYQSANDFVQNELCKDLPRHPALKSAQLERCNAIKKWINGAQLERQQDRMGSTATPSR